MKKKFDTCVDDDNVEILDFISSLFHGGRWDKHFEISVEVREFEYDEGGKKVYVD